jgi:cytochrome c6
MMKTAIQAGVLAAGALVCLAAQTAQPERPKGDAARGKLVFDDNCSDCHYRDSKDAKVGPGLEGLKNGTLPSGRKATHDRILDIVNNGPAEMTSFQDRLTEQEKEDVVAYVMTL